MRSALFLVSNICAVVLIASASAFGQATPAKTPVAFTEKDREFALKYLTETRDDYIKQLTGTSDAQLNFRAAEGRWTIAEIAEHITVVEAALFGTLIDQVLKSAPIKCEDIPRFSDTGIILAITNRSQKFTAPEQVRPNGRWKTRDELRASFDKQRGQMIDFVRNNKMDLRGVFGKAPMGTIDGFQWLIFITGHGDRHLAQLKEVKTDPNYPKK